MNIIELNQDVWTIEGTNLFYTKGKVCYITMGQTTSPGNINLQVSVKCDDGNITRTAIVVHENVFKNKQSLVKALAAKRVFLTKQDAIVGSKKAIQEWHKDAKMVAKDNYNEILADIENQKKKALARLGDL